MSEPATINQRSSLGLEVVPGTVVPATRQLAALKIEPKVEFTTTMFRPSGLKYPTTSLPNREWASARMTGIPTYNELPYVLASLIGQPTSVAETATGGAWEWLWDVSSTEEAPPTTYSLEVGTVGNEQVMAHSWINELELTVPSSGDASMGGSVIGRAMAPLAAFAGGLAQLDAVPIQGSQFCLYMDDTAAALGTTKMDRNFNTQLRLPPRRQAVWTVDCEEPSFAALVEIEGGEPMANILVAANGQGEDLLATARSGASKFIRLHAEGPDINGVDSHYFEFDMAGKIDRIDAYGDSGGVRSLPYGFHGVHDAAWGKSHQVRVITTLPAL